MESAGLLVMQSWRLPRVKLSDQNSVDLWDNDDGRDYLMMLTIIMAMTKRFISEAE